MILSLQFNTFPFPVLPRHLAAAILTSLLQSFHMRYESLFAVSLTNKIIIRSNTNKNIHCVKSVQIRSFFWSVFSRIQTEYGEILRSFFWSVFSPIRTEYGEILVFGHFSRSVQIWHPLHFQRTKKAAFNWSHDTVKRGLISWSSHSQKLV